jgi:hypothetical protein
MVSLLAPTGSCFGKERVDCFTRVSDVGTVVSKDAGSRAVSDELAEGEQQAPRAATFLRVGTRWLCCSDCRCFRKELLSEVNG